MFYQMSSFLIVLCTLLGTTMSAIYIGDNQRIDGNIRSGPYEDIIIGGRINSQPNGNRFPTNGRSGSGIYVGDGNTIRGNVRSDLPPGANLNLGSLLSNLPSTNRRSAGSSYQPPNNYNRYNTYPSENGRPGIVIGNGNRLRGGISAPLY